MHIIRSTDAISVDHPVFLIFGQPGIGKTSLGYSAASALLLDFDQGAHRAVNRHDTLLIPAWADVVELMQTPAALTPYQTIVVDTVGRCLDLMTADIIRESPKLGPNGNLSQQGWGTLKNRFRQWMASLRGLGKDVLLVAHDKEDKDGDTRIVRPDIVGGSFGEVLKIADFVGYVYMSGRDRVLDFNPTDRWLGKNPGGWAPVKLPPAAQAQTVMADLIAQGRAALGRISAGSAQVAQQVDAWRLAITAYGTPEDLNRVIAEVRALPPMVLAPVRKLLHERATALGLVWRGTKDAGAYVVPAAKTA